MAPDIPTPERLYERIKDQILSGDYSPGQKIDLNMFVDAYRVSMTPMRELIYRLLGERIVQGRQDGGFQIPLLSVHDLQHLYAWNGHHLLTAVHLISSAHLADIVRPFSIELEQSKQPNLLAMTERLFWQIGRATGNDEFSSQIELASARLRARLRSPAAHAHRRSKVADAAMVMSVSATAVSCS